MKIASFSDGLEYNESRISIKVIMETESSKEIRIVFKEGQVMKEHKAPYPITVHVLDGAIGFGVGGEFHLLSQGSIISLQANVPHDLVAKEDIVVRLTLSKSDAVDRVSNVANQD